MTSQLKQGIKVESEHKDVYSWLNKYVKKNNKLPSQKDVFKHIAETHLKERKDYYTKLKQAKL